MDKKGNKTKTESKAFDSFGYKIECAQEKSHE